MMPQQETAIRDLWAKGVSIAVIAKQLGMSRGTVTKRAIELGLPNRLHVSPEKRAQIFELRAQGKTYSQISAEVGHTEKVIRRLLAFADPQNASKPRKWYNADVETMRALWDASKPAHVNAKAVSQAIGCHPESVIRKAHHIGLSGANLFDDSAPATEKIKHHAEACLREGGFPVAQLIGGRAVWLWPAERRIAA